MAQEVVKSDDQLVSEFLTGHSESFEELITRYSTKVYNLSYRLTKNHQDAEEVLQDVFTTVFKKVGKFEGKCAFSSWIYRITVNSSFMKLRSRRRRRTVFLEDLGQKEKDDCRKETSTPSCAVEETFKSEVRSVLEKQIERLPDDYRGVFILRDVDGFTNKEVARLLNLSTPAVKSRLHRARSILKKRVKSFYNEAYGHEGVGESVNGD
jgi:RNA polymerase sigma-70 factor (ECF subfamily)